MKGQGEPIPDKGEYVGSGTFRIARERALEVLSQYRLPEPGLFILPLFRCAVASGAKVIRMSGGSREFRLSFDGSPFAEAELRDPYAGLFEAAPAGGERGRELATGLVSALGMRPSQISLRSGNGRERSELLLRAEGKDDELRPCADGEAATVIQVFWGTDTPADWDRFLQPGLFSMSPAQVWVGDELVRRVPESESTPGYAFQSGGVRGWLTLPPYDGKEPKSATLQLYKHGAFIAPVLEDSPVAAFYGHLNDDRLQLTAGLTGVANDGRLRKTLELATGQAEGLLRWACKEAARRLPEAARFVRQPGFGQFWREETLAYLSGEETYPRPLERDFLTRGLQLAAALFGGATDEEKAAEQADAKRLGELAWSLRLAYWLRDACRRLLKNQDKDSRSSHLEALWEAPIFLGAGGEVLSLREIDEERRRRRKVVFARRWVKDAKDVPWCPTAAESSWLMRTLQGVVRGEVRLEAYGRE